MELLYQISLVMHIVSGHVALILGVYIMIATKGTKQHRLAGRIFYYSMCVICISAIYISIVKNYPHLLHIGIFAFYQNYAGRRAIQNKSLRFNLSDWMIWALSMVNGVGMLLSLNIVLMVFGGISLSMSVTSLMQTIQILKGNSPPAKAWLAKHIGMMVGAYISTITAFIVVNISTTGVWWILWLLPTIILVPLIVFWTRKYTSSPKKTLA